MKKILGLCLLVLLSSVNLFAQDRRGQRDFDPTERTEKMIRDLNLNNDQAERLRTIEKEYSDRMKMDFDRNRSETETDRERMREEMEKRREEKNARVREFLTDEQYKNYLEKHQMPPRPDNKRRK